VYILTLYTGKSLFDHVDVELDDMDVCESVRKTCEFYCMMVCVHILTPT